MTTLQVILIIAGVLAVSQAWLVREVLRARRRAAAQAARVDEIARDLAGLGRAARTAGEHLTKLEQQMYRLTERQNQVELRGGGDRVYANAIDAVHRGADVDDLMAQCGLTRGEAELVVQLHGMARAG